MRPGTPGDRFELLAAIAEVADGTLTLADTVRTILAVVVPAFADLAVLDAVAPGGGVRRLGARVEATGAHALESALGQRPIIADAPLGVGRAVAGGTSQLLSTVDEDHLRAMAHGEDDLELLRSLGLRSALFVPLRARGRSLGAFSCGVGPSGRRYDQRDLRFAEVLAGRIALALDNAGLSATVGALERQLESTLANLAEAVLVRDAGGRLVFANAAVARLLGFPSASALKAESMAELMQRFDAFDETGRRLELSDIPSMRAMHGESPEPLLVRNVVRSTGEERWLLHKATPVFDSDGKLSLVVNVIENLTDLKRAELAQRLLAEAGRELSSSLDYEQTLQRVSRLAVPQLADWCAVRIRGPHGELEAVAVAHTDPDRVALAREFGARNPTRVGDRSAAAEVARTGQAMLLREISPEVIVTADLTEEQAALIRELRMRSVIIVPLDVPGQRPLGVLTLVMAESGRRFDERDLALAEELGRRAGTAVENARLYTERSHVAATLQQSLLPDALPEIEGFRLASLYRAAGQHSDVGGDFYDVFAVPAGWMVVMGDVAGRGPDAAALTSLARYTLRTAARLLSDPVAAVRELNRELRGRSHPAFVTIACALIRETPDGPCAEVVLAGHPPPFHVHAGVPVQAGHLASPLGAWEDGDWRTATIRLEPGDQLVLYTDGVIDTAGAADRFGEERLGDVLRGAAGAADAVERIERAVHSFAHGPQDDDTAILAVERLAAAATAAPSGLGRRSDRHR